MAEYQQPFGKQLIAGDDWSWTDRLERYPSTEWTLKYFLRGPAEGDSLNLTAGIASDNVSFLTTVSGAETAALGRGTYAWQKCIFNTQGAQPWDANTAYAVDDLIYDGECIQQCTTAGTSGAEPPTWNDTLNGTTTDNDVVWTCLGPGARSELERGQVEIWADISSETAPVDGRSWVKKSLDAVRAVIEGRASRVERQYMIAGRELQLMSPRT